jgi:mannitol 2-dehydrogenase
MPSIAEHIMAHDDTPRRLTLVVAAWFRYLSGYDENGNEFVIKETDEIDIKNLQAKARDGGHLPNNLMSIRNLFGDDLRDDKGFMGELTKALDSLYNNGAKKTLANYA